MAARVIRNSGAWGGAWGMAWAGAWGAAWAAGSASTSRREVVRLRSALALVVVMASPIA